MENKEILKPQKKLLVIAIILMIVTVGMFYLNTYVETKRAKEKTEAIAENYDDLISEGRDNEKEYVEVTIADVPYHVATKEVDTAKYKYYIVFDVNDLMYVVRLTDSTYYRLEDMYESNPEEFSYKLVGYIYDTPNELEEIIIDVYNEVMGEDVITEENFEMYFGKTYLDETKTPVTVSSAATVIFIVIGVLSGTFAFVFILVYIINSSRRKKVLKNYPEEDLESELDKSSTIAYEKQKVYLTDKYLISAINGLSVIEYNDIAWMYNEKRSYNGIPTGVTLLAYQTNGKRVQLASTWKNEEILKEIMTKIYEKNPNILVGFTPENRKQFKEIKKAK